MIFKVLLARKSSVWFNVKIAILNCYYIIRMKHCTYVVGETLLAVIHTSWHTFLPFTQNVYFLFPLWKYCDSKKKLSRNDHWASSVSERNAVRVLRMSLLLSFIWTQFVLQHFCFMASTLTNEGAFCFLLAIFVGRCKEINRR